ncbi:hypothetical protein [Diaphorobacter sp.]|uniref:hypothetical protein n=1 Tax=Diaphorobacter sp. TaxID=1934310 RepID=UPI0025903725|nr:hypothetical protein [Diaphorobacter sp.]
MNQSEIRDRLLELARVRLKNRFGAFEQFRFTVDGLVEGSAILARASMLPAPWIAGFRLGLGEASKQIDTHLLRIIDEWAQRKAPARQIPALEGVQPLPAEPHTAPVVGENAEQRQARRWQLCIDKGLTMPTETYAQLPRGIKEIAKAENITRQALAQDLNAYRERLFGK